MFGVVIWSDIEEGKAVIWCEDHGDLAFCRQEPPKTFVQMDPGDLVQFDLMLDKSQRIACNPRLVAEGVYDGLSGQLVSAQPDGPARPEGRRDSPGKIVVFDDFRQSRECARPRRSATASN